MHSKVYLGCDTGSECMGYTTCIDLSTGKKDLPEELFVEGFSCQAFPQAYMMHRLMVVLIMVACLVPVQVTTGFRCRTRKCDARPMTSAYESDHLDVSQGMPWWIACRQFV